MYYKQDRVSPKMSRARTTISSTILSILKKKRRGVDFPTLKREIRKRLGKVGDSELLIVLGVLWEQRQIELFMGEEKLFEYDRYHYSDYYEREYYIWEGDEIRRLIKVRRRG